MTDNKVCPKCTGAMKVGSYTGGPIDWEKDGERSFLKRLEHKIVAYACESCGYMENYVKK